MIVKAPGKLVLSGAYSVLEGAPAIVAAVDRYVIADGSLPASYVTEEVDAAIAMGRIDRATWFDASTLRTGEGADGAPSRKLGLGSSAAILVASMAAREAWRRRERRRAPPIPEGASAPPGGALADPAQEPPWDESTLFLGALASHRYAQRGGSGVDVAASVFGGVLRCWLRPAGELSAASHTLPPGLRVEVLASGSSTRTTRMLERVRGFGVREPDAHRALLASAAEWARAVAEATDIAAFVAALACQTDTLAELGDRAGAPIVTADVRRLRRLAEAEGAAVAPSGAGGGDVAVFVGVAAPSAAFLDAALACGMERVPMALGARGVHVALDE